MPLNADENESGREKEGQCNTNRYTLHISTFILIFWAITQIEALDIIHSSSLDLSCRTIYVIQELLLLVFFILYFIIN